jgi:hypothetical protein
MASTRQRSLSQGRVAQSPAYIISFDSSSLSSAASQSGGTSIPPMAQHDRVCQPEQLNPQNDTIGDPPSPDILMPNEHEATDRTTSPSMMEATPEKTVPKSHGLYMRQWILWSAGNRNIILLCLLIIIPITAFTAIILRLVFSNKIDPTQCAHQELCPTNGTTNGLDATHNYYVNYPAARLAFVASWSSTVSQLHTSAALLF